MAQTGEDIPFFDRERDRLAREITTVRNGRDSAEAESDFIQGFEDLLSSTNVLNRKLEEVLGMTKEYHTIAALWQTFHELMREASEEEEEEAPGGLPGTGGHTVSMKQSKAA
jgi:DASH complex subunit DAD1